MIPIRFKATLEKENYIRDYGFSTDEHFERKLVKILISPVIDTQATKAKGIRGTACL